MRDADQPTAVDVAPVPGTEGAGGDERQPLTATSEEDWEAWVHHLNLTEPHFNLTEFLQHHLNETHHHHHHHHNLTEPRFNLTEFLQHHPNKTHHHLHHNETHHNNHTETKVNIAFFLVYRLIYNRH